MTHPTFTFLTETGRYDRAAIMRAAWARVKAAPNNNRARRLSMALGLIWAQAKDQREQFGLNAAERELHDARTALAAADLMHDSTRDWRAARSAAEARIAALSAPKQG
ncbi:hypothetical protein [uncultured Alsobacter sp.]|uniref:hypothetical protein n=1 Tax=uncultured Alsobacter sp. TaxID=1748258 RepID=UPI0025DA58D2|nr:hypothetical protein [uncultured Alsobacter sp.]